MFLSFLSLIWGYTSDITFDAFSYKADKNWIIIKVNVPKDHYVYANTQTEEVTPLNIRITGAKGTCMSYECPLKKDGIYIYKDNIVAMTPFDKIESTIIVNINYGICTDASCYPPQKISKTFDINTLKSIDKATFERFKKVCELGNNKWAMWPIILALLGGLLLNITPCVLPVVSLKMLSFMNNTVSRFKSSILYSFGNITTFLNLGFLTVFMKSMGADVGWGFQLQNPIFVFLLCVMFLVMILNVFDIFVVPAFQTSTPRSSFTTGILAVLVGAPCTVPMMSTAMSYSLTQSNVEALMIFGSLGFGMSLPFLLLSFLPVRILPKPGAWLFLVKPIMGFALLVTLVWLLQVYISQTSIDHFLPIGFILVSLAMMFWLWSKSVLSKWIVWPLILGFVSYGIYETMPKEKHFISYSANALESNLASNKKTLIVVTAKWCLTCKINHMVLQRNTVQKLLEETNTEVLLADWTNQSLEVTRLLRKHNILGVPAVVLVSKDTEEVLPEILTENILDKFLKET